MIIGLVSFHTCPKANLGEKDAGGMNVYLDNLARSLDLMGHTVYVFTRKHDFEESVEFSIGTRSKLVHINAGNQEVLKKDLIDLISEFSSNVQTYMVDEGIELEILHTHYWLSGLIGDLLSETWGIPHVITFHTLAKTKLRALADGEEHFSRTDSEYKLMDSVDGILVLTQKEIQDIRELYGEFSNKIAVVPPGIDLKMFYDCGIYTARNELNIPRESKMILFVGRIDPIKGLELLVRAVSLIASEKDVLLYIVGGGDEGDKYLSFIKSLVEKTGLVGKVIFTGPIAHDGLRTYYNAADVFVLPSHYESLGFVAIEAMACGTPVVASRVGGIPSVVDHGSTGYLIPWRCPEAFAGQIEVLLKNEDLSGFMSQQALKRSYSLSWDSTAKTVSHYYAEIISDVANIQFV